MKLKQLIFNFSIFLFLETNVCFSQSLSPSNEFKEHVVLDHLAFENNKGDSILYYNGYSVIYSYKYNLPLYVFQLLTVDQLTLDTTRSKAKRASSFLPRVLPNGKLSANNADYYKSGYDRGHMAPAGDFVWSKKLKDETFNYTNINPQTPVLNRGIWANLERRIRSSVQNCLEDAHVVTGAVFNPNCTKKIGPDSLCVPASYFKIVYFEKQKVMYSFLFDNTVSSFDGDITDFQVPVDYIEKITGEDFFDLLDNKIEEELESAEIKFND